MEPEPNEAARKPPSTQDLPRLSGMGEPHAEAEYPLDQDVFTLGRSSGNHLAFPGDDSLSRNHARIIRRLGLLWLEDLGSTNGSFLSPPGGQERRLCAHAPAILIENSCIRLGLRLRFQVHGVIATLDEAAHTLCQGLQYMLLELYRRIHMLPERQRGEHLAAIHTLEQQLAAATNEEEMALLAMEGLERLTERLSKAPLPANSLVNTIPAPELPPMPDDLPSPADEHRLHTILNVFITDVRRCFPADEDGSHDPTK